MVSLTISPVLEPTLTLHDPSSSRYFRFSAPIEDVEIIISKRRKMKLKKGQSVECNPKRFLFWKYWQVKIRNKS